jgi:hypothetical protein
MSFFQISNTAVNASLVVVAQVANKEREWAIMDSVRIISEGLLLAWTRHTML